MPPATGADLPPETIAKILSCFMIVVARREENFRRWKHELVPPSLVCKYWSECIRPALFQDITLKDATDLLFLENIVYSPRFEGSSLNGAIKCIRAEHHFPPLPVPWLHRLHPVMAHLPDATLRCEIWQETGGRRLVPVRWPPYAALPRVPPSFYRLQLHDIQVVRSEFKNTTELARLVDSFPALQECYFYQLTFLDPSTVVQARRIPWRVPKGLWRCDVTECPGMSVSAQTTLALDLLGVTHRLSGTLLDTLLASVPSNCRQARVELFRSGGGPLDGHVPDKVGLRFSPIEDPDLDRFVANIVWATGARATPTHAQDPYAHVRMIALTASFAAVGDGDPPSFDGFREAAGSAHFEELRFFVREGNALDEQGMRVLMRSVLRREQLTWALEKGVLRLQRSYFEVETGIWKDVAYISNAVLLSLSAGRSVIAINDTPPTLDIDEAAECFSQVVIGQEISDYLQRLPALRAERAKAKKGSSEETSGTPETQDGVVPAQRTAKDTSKLPESPNTAPPSRQIRAAGGEGDEDGKEEAGQDMGGL